jgi:hypothetical protein
MKLLLHHTILLIASMIISILAIILDILVLTKSSTDKQLFTTHETFKYGPEVPELPDE